MSTNPQSFTSIRSAPPNVFQWVAEYDKGQIYTQYGGPGRKFTDVLKMSDSNTLERLHLVRIIRDREDKFALTMRPRFTVDLQTGIFNINGEDFNENPKGVSFANTKFRPIYHRRVRGGIGMDGGKGYASLAKFYYIGWQTTVDGNNYQRIIQYDVPNNQWLFKEKR